MALDIVPTDSRTSSFVPGGPTYNLIFGLGRDEQLPDRGIIKWLKNRNDGLSVPPKSEVAVDTPDEDMRLQSSGAGEDFDHSYTKGEEDFSCNQGFPLDDLRLISTITNLRRLYSSQCVAG